MYINELNPMKKIDKIINESIKDVVKDKVKKGINKYKDTFSYNEEDDAENPAAVDFKEVGKDAWKSAKNLVKKGAQKYKNAFSYNEEDDAENPAAIDFKEVGKSVKNWLKGKNKKSMKESKQIIRLTESDLHRVIEESVKQVIYESFDSNEDMTQYRDLYKPGKRHFNVDVDGSMSYGGLENDGELGNGPFVNQVEYDFEDGYDYSGTDMYNDEASEYNDELYNRLATKGGQMSHDWEEVNPDYTNIDNKQKSALDVIRRSRKFQDDKYSQVGERHRNNWVKGNYDEEDLEDMWSAAKDIHKF